MENNAWESNAYFNGTSNVVASSASYVSSPLMEAHRSMKDDSIRITIPTTNNSQPEQIVTRGIPASQSGQLTSEITAISSVGLDPEKEDYLFYSNPNSLKSPKTIEDTSSITPSEKSPTGKVYGGGMLPIPGENGKEIPSALANPTVRKKLAEKKQHFPFFMWIITALQIITVIISMVLNYFRLGSPIETTPDFNYMIGPAPGVLITMGARFTPCIRPNTSLDGPSLRFQCIPGSVGNQTINGTPICTLGEVCGFSKVTDQWYRFIIPIFLHGGVVHLAFNLMFQIKTGIQMEKDWGWWRVAGIYFISGIAGFMFGGNYAGLTPSVGCSGALYGLMACLMLDLFQNWQLLLRPWLELLKMIVTVVISISIGFLPYIDNFAHVGGFVAGIPAGLLLMPTIHYGKWDKRRKLALMIISVPILIGMFVYLGESFYNETQGTCEWCKYINCIPGLPWCEQKWGSIDSLYKLPTLKI